jgi:hypothetical protein
MVVNCNDDVRVSRTGQLPGAATVACSALFGINQLNSFCRHVVKTNDVATMLQFYGSGGPSLMR